MLVDLEIESQEMIDTVRERVPEESNWQMAAMRNFEHLADCS